MNCYYELDGVAPLMTDPPPTNFNPLHNIPMLVNTAFMLKTLEDFLSYVREALKKTIESLTAVKPSPGGWGQRVGGHSP